VAGVSVIIPFHDEPAMTVACLRSIAGLGLAEILLVDNRSSRDAAGQVEAAAEPMPNARVVSFDEPFNFQRLNNWAAAQTKGDVLWLLNNDVVVPGASAGLVDRMVARAREADIGAVGCVLVYGDEATVQHAGVYLVPGGTATHLYAGRSLSSVRSDGGGTPPYPISDDREMTAVTAASLMVARAKWDAIGGLNEAFTIGGGDVDLCLRLAARGWASILVGARHGVMIHHEARSRTGMPIPYSDYAESYESYITAFDIDKGDPFIDVTRLGASDA